METHTSDSQTLAGILKKNLDAMSPSEKKVARALIADYPVAGLEPVAKLAERASVSAPSVLRMLSRIGLHSYTQMQEQLREEISQRNASPMDMYEAKSSTTRTDDHLLAQANSVFTQELSDTFAEVPDTEFDEVVALLANPKVRIWTVGGRYSSMLAEYLTMHLRMLRPDVHFVGRGESDKSLALLDFGPRDVLVGFDFRRYQSNTIEFFARAKESRVKTVLITDPWLSPAAKHADFLLSASVEAPSPFDSLVPSLALTEMLIAAVVGALGSEPLGRIQAFDSWE
ncbi:MurR/RpiR family transcriptional regulator [Leucobacter sp. cx-42]|uniref:MurR/RpiR family transcriptional regulator n=1 Tax=unclassified Leucobacter TaxID=2621730 RepID=UPI00165DE16B|nr:MULTISPECIES: MurR/RpiR family transcriptional regulator [unclassified Leucobacter]MBC9953729.1 MurR/RpiR family transcriptional regulator [Leucobacter sp. cx-42]